MSNGTQNFSKKRPFLSFDRIVKADHVFDALGVISKTGEYCGSYFLQNGGLRLAFFSADSRMAFDVEWAKSCTQAMWERAGVRRGNRCAAFQVE